MRLTRQLFLFAVIAQVSARNHGTRGGTSICDGYEEKAKGLCIAFCKAQDCASALERGKSCQKLKENFVEISGESRFPCEEEDEEECPCWTKADLAQLEDKSEITYSRFWTSTNPSFERAEYTTLEDRDGNIFRTISQKDGLKICVSSTDSSGAYLSDAEFDFCSSELVAKSVELNLGQCQLREPSSECPCWSDEALHDVQARGIDRDRMQFDAGGLFVSVILTDQESLRASAVPTGYSCVKWYPVGGLVPYVRFSDEAAFNRCSNDILLLSQAHGLNACTDSGVLAAVTLKI